MALRWLHSIGAMLQRLPRAVCWALVIAWFGLITWLSSIPGTKIPSPAIWAVLSNLAHAPLFGTLALWIILLVPRRAGWPDLIRSNVRSVLLAVAACGVADELHQRFLTAGRDMSIFDLCTDLTGASAVLVVVRYVGRDAGNTRGLALRMLSGLAACIASAVIATFVPRMFPSLAPL